MVVYTGHGRVTLSRHIPVHGSGTRTANMVQGIMKPGVAVPAWEGGMVPELGLARVSK
jgi:hypothetical protein